MLHRRRAVTVLAAVTASTAPAALAQTLQIQVLRRAWISCPGARR